MRQSSINLLACLSGILVIFGLSLSVHASTVLNCTVEVPGMGGCGWLSPLYVLSSLPIGLAAGAITFIRTRHLVKASIFETNRLPFVGFLLSLVLLVAIPAFYILCAATTGNAFLPKTIYLSSVISLALSLSVMAINLYGLLHSKLHKIRKPTRGFAYSGIAISSVIFGSVLFFHFQALSDTDFARVYYLYGNCPPKAGSIIPSRNSPKACIERRSAQYGDAIDYYSKAIALDPQYQDAYLERAQIYSRKGEFTLAVEDLRIVVGLRPDWARLLNNLAWTLAYHLDADYEEALGYALRAIQCDGCSDQSKSSYHDTLAFIYYKMQDFQQALNHYDISLSLNFNNAYSYLGRADTNYSLGNFEAALSDYLTYMSLEPNGSERDRVEQRISELEDK